MPASETDSSSDFLLFLGFQFDPQDAKLSTQAPGHCQDEDPSFHVFSASVSAADTITTKDSGYGSDNETRRRRDYTQLDGSIRYDSSFTLWNPPTPIIACASAFSEDVRKLEHIETLNQEHLSIMNEETSSPYSGPANQSLTNSPIPEIDGGTSSGTSGESDSSEDISTQSPENDAWLTVAYSKHRMMVSLMRDVYTIFDSHWKAEIRNRTGSQEASEGSAGSQKSSFRTPTSTGNGKRKLQDRDSEPPEANEEKRRNKSKRSGEGGRKRLFACFFHKHNAQKYCSNSETGSKYRICAGPGFSRISLLKQHLRRIHIAPIHCPRCWLVMGSQAEMDLHANAEERCERIEPQVVDGVGQDKMRLISQTRGVSWEGIYEILFPGAPVPSPYYEADELTPENQQPPSPPSRELRDFEHYNRTTLPLLVEANLRAIVESQIAPIEERVRVMVVDIVRTCQSTVAQNFRTMFAPTSPANNPMQSSPQEISSIVTTGDTPGESAAIGMNDTTGNPLDFFQEPPHLTAEARASLPSLMYNHSHVTGNQNQGSDSGYGTLPVGCGCSCHDYSNSWNIANGRSSCQSCAYMHPDPDDFDWDFLHDNMTGRDDGDAR